MYNNIKKLCEMNGISGRESMVAQEIVKQIRPMATTVEVDKLGNVIAFKKGKKEPKNKILLSAHTDEVGMIVTGITDKGLLQFDTVGGINAKVILGRKVCMYEHDVYGVIGTKAVHLQSASERETVVGVDKLYIDIGADNKAEAEEMVSIGAAVTFIGDYLEFGDNFIKAKAIDDRAGCAIMIEVMKQDLEFDCYFTFVVQEEVGLRGAKVASYTVNPDVAIVVESTASGDVSDVKELERVTVMGEGAVVTYMDNATIYHKGLYDFSYKLAKENNIKWQTKTKIAGGNDAGAIQPSRSGVATVAVSIPSRYIHSPANVVKKEDVDAVYELVLALTNNIGDLDV